MRVASICAIGLLAVVAAPVLGGSIIGNSTQTLWNGNTYGTTSWFVGNDLPPFDPNDPEYFEPEGMTYYNGTLYVAGDSDETAPTLISYVTGPTGSLAAGVGVELSAGGSVWGPEGITVNTSGAGYGGFAPGSSPYLVSLESGNDPENNYEGFVGAIDLSGSPASVENIHKPFVDFDPDDIAYISQTDQFAVINDPARIDFYDHTSAALSPATGSFSVESLNWGDAKGLAVVSEDFAELITGLDITGETLLVAHESNDLTLWTLSGDQIGDVLPFTAGLLPPEADESEIESIAVDELNSLIFVGDEAGLAITTIAIPEPSALAGLGLLAVLGCRRR